MADKKLTVYIAGPVTGVDHYWKAFEKADDDLTGRGFTVLNPARLPSDLDNAKAMPICLAMVEAADAVVLLPGWENSEGAKLETAYAKKLGKPAVTMQEFLSAQEATEAFVGAILNAFEKAVKK